MDTVGGVQAPGRHPKRKLIQHPVVSETRHALRETRSWINYAVDRTCADYYARRAGAAALTWASRVKEKTLPGLQDQQTTPPDAWAGLPDDEAALAWVENLESFQVFQLEDIPVASDTAMSVLDEMQSADDPIIEHLADGLYWKKATLRNNPYRVRSFYRSPYILQSMSPPGSGLGEGYALSMLGYTTQMPNRSKVAVIDNTWRSPELSPPRSPQIIVRHNPRRLDLTWHEVSFLEAAMVWFSNDTRYTRRARLSELREGTLAAVGQNPLVRRDALLWAMETEHRPKLGCHAESWDAAAREFRRLPKVLTSRSRPDA